MGIVVALVAGACRLELSKTNHSHHDAVGCGRIVGASKVAPHDKEYDYVDARRASRLAVTSLASLVYFTCDARRDDVSASKAC